MKLTNGILGLAILSFYSGVCAQQQDIGSPEVQATKTISLQENCDSPGHDLRSHPAKDVEACRESCQKEKSCQGFSFISGWNRCFLKSKVKRTPTIRMYSGHVSETKDEQGKLRRTILSIDQDKDDSGKDILNLSQVVSEKACSESCLAHDTCQAFAYIEGYRDCWLKKNHGRSSRKIFYCGKVE